MRKIALLLSLSVFFSAFSFPSSNAADYTVPPKTETIELIQKINDFWLKNNPDPGEPTQYTSNKKNPANGWDISVYFMGNMAAYEATKDQRYLDYAIQWANKYNWNPYTIAPNTNADSQACFVTYLDIAKYAPQRANLEPMMKVVNTMLNDSKSNYWTWIDAVFMASPIFGKLYEETGEQKYLDKLHALYEHPLKKLKLYDQKNGLWYRDAKWGIDFGPGSDTTNPWKGQVPCFWGRGNGWIYAATARILEYIPKDDPHYDTYMDIYKNMSLKLRNIQSADGFWRSDLLHPDQPDIRINDVPEASGTSLFTYGMAIGLKNGWLDRSYMDTLNKAWTGLTTEALINGERIGWAQGGGDRPYNVNKNTTNCFTTGAFLMAANQMVLLDDMQQPYITTLAGKVITTVVPGTRAYFHYNVPSESESNPTLIVACYSGTTEKPVLLETAAASAQDGQTQIDLTVNIPKGTLIARAFVWYNGTLTPLTNTYEVQY